MNKQDIIYKRIAERVANEDPKQNELIVDYIVRITKLEELLKALRYISLSKMRDTDDHYLPTDSHSSKYWYEKCKELQDVAEDAIIEMYVREGNEEWTD